MVWSVDIEYSYLGLLPLEESLKIMDAKSGPAVQQKKCFLFGQEHPLVYTSGLKSSPEHILKEIPITKLRRGGSVTLHNPGQFVFYTVLPLEATPGLEPYIRFLEKIIIETLAAYGVPAHQHPEHTGVWTALGKIAFIGLAAKKGTIYHGCAINIENDLGDYAPIVSCGLTDPIARVCDHPEAKVPSLVEFGETLVQNFRKGFPAIEKTSFTGA